MRMRTMGWCHCNPRLVTREGLVASCPATGDALERLKTTGGGGGTPLWTPFPPPPWIRFHNGKFAKGNVCLGHFWYTNFWVPDPPPSLSSDASLARYPASPSVSRGHDWRMGTGGGGGCGYGEE